LQGNGITKVPFVTKSSQSEKVTVLAAEIQRRKDPASFSVAERAGLATLPTIDWES
jgi:hypothetical protein